MNAKLIVIEGKTYRSVDEMPPDVRQKYEQAMSALGDTNGNHIPDALEALNIFADQNKNGTPDILENLTAGNAMVNSVKIIVDGKEFNGIENLPPEARTRYEEAMRKLDRNQNGIPDFVEGLVNATHQTMNVSTSLGAESPDRSTASPALTPSVVSPPSVGISQGKPLPVDSAITPDTSNGWMLALAGVFILLLCLAGAVGVWYFFLR